MVSWKFMKDAKALCNKKDGSLDPASASTRSCLVEASLPAF